MPNQRRKDKRLLSLWIPVATYRAFQYRAKALGMTMTEILTAYIDKQVARVKLTSEDYAEIAKEEQDRQN